MITISEIKSSGGALLEQLGGTGQTVPQPPSSLYGCLAGTAGEVAEIVEHCFVEDWEVETAES